MSTNDPHTTLSCSELVDKISDYHDGRFECGSDDAECIEQHLATCARCAELLEDYRALSAAAKFVDKSDLPCNVSAIRDAVAKSLHKIVFVRRLAWTGAGISAAAAVAATVVLFVMPPRSRSPAVPLVQNTIAAPQTAAAAPAAPADRERLIQEIIADLKAQPRDFADETSRDRICRRLREAGFTIDASDPSTLVVVESDGRLRGQMLELQRLMREAGAAPTGSGVLRVDDPAR
jgi:hypothetical protein